MNNASSIYHNCIESCTYHELGTNITNSIVSRLKMAQIGPILMDILSVANRTYTYEYIHTYIYVYIYIFMHICIYVKIYIYAYMYICTYMYIYVSV